MNINKYLASEKYYLSKIDNYFDITDFDKKNKIKIELFKRIDELVKNILRRYNLYSKKNYEDELKSLIYRINDKTIQHNDDIIHIDFSLMKNQKIIQNFFVKYIIDRFKIDYQKISTIKILNLVEYTAERDDVFNILTINSNIGLYLKSKISIYKDETPHSIEIITVPVISDKDNLIRKVNRKYKRNIYDTLYIFEDSLEKHLTNDKGKNNDSIRKYNFLGKNKIPLTAGVITYDESGNQVADNITQTSLNEIEDLIIKYRYKKIVYLSKTIKDDNTKKITDTKVFYSYFGIDNASKLDKISTKLQEMYDLLIRINKRFHITKSPTFKSPSVQGTPKLSTSPYDISGLFSPKPPKPSTSPKPSISPKPSTSAKPPKPPRPPRPPRQPNPSTSPSKSSESLSKQNKLLSKISENKFYSPNSGKVSKSLRPPKPPITEKDKPESSELPELLSKISKSKLYSPNSGRASKTSKTVRPIKPITQTTQDSSPQSLVHEIPVTEPVVTHTEPSVVPSVVPSIQETDDNPTLLPIPIKAPTNPVKPIKETSSLSKKNYVLKINIIPSVFIQRGQPGDFLWEITTNYRGTDTLYIFNDNLKDHKTSEPGRNNGIIRQFNKHSNLDDPNFIPRSAGISTGWGDGFDLTINGNVVTKYDAFKKEDKKLWKEIIDNEITEIENLLKTGNYKTIVFSAQGNEKNEPLKQSNGIPILGTYIFKDLDKDITTYIPNQIYRRLQTVRIDSSKKNNKDFVQILIDNITSYKSSSKEFTISNYTFKNIIPDYLYYYSDKINGINIFANKLLINKTIESERNLKQLNILNLLNKKNCIHIPFLYNKVDINNQLSIYFTEYLDNNLFNLLNDFKQKPLDDHWVNVIKNMMQQLLMAIISYHTNTGGYINTNINSKNIYFKYNKENLKNTYICYRIDNINYYVKYNGYIWYLTDFSHSTKMPKYKNIILNKYYDSYHIYCEFKVIVETVKNMLYAKNSKLDDILDTILNLLESRLFLGFYKAFSQEDFNKTTLGKMDYRVFKLLKKILEFNDTDKSNKELYNDTIYKIL